jgi:cysteine-rich repeat protein
LKRWLLVPILLGCLRTIGCSSDAAAPAAEAKPPCTPRKTVFCRCPRTGEGGWQTCAEDGSGFDACVPCDGSNLDPTEGAGAGPATSKAECGNGKEEAGEQCDDGNLDDHDACLSDCRIAKCGDGMTRTGVEECDDGNDDDADGCTSQCKLKIPPSDKCPGDALELTADPAGKKVAGDFKALAADHEGSCGGTGRDAVFSFKAPGNGEAVVSLSVLDGAKVDAVLYVRSDCEASTKELACANSGGAGANELANPFAITKGATYFAFVDSQGDASGGFSLKVRFRPDDACEGAGGPCEATGQGQCAKGTLVCSAEKTELVCQATPPGAETCGDGLDGDCDGIVDNGCPCAHDVCAAGVALAPDCTDAKGKQSDCIKAICAADDFCCGKEWDATCTGEVLTVCGIGNCLQATCAHPLCQVGAPLEAGCDGTAQCVEAICKTDGFCCGQGWDANCIEKIADICKIQCL